MHKGRKWIFLPFAFFIIGSFSPLRATHYIFRGFRLQDPVKLLADAEANASASQLKKILIQSGYFRQVECKEEGDSTIFTVIEYPLVSRIRFRGNTVYQDRELIEALKLKTGAQFNSHAFRENLKTFYQQSSRDGYTHWLVTAAEIGKDGSLVIDVDEGIFQDVIVQDDVIDRQIILHFFSFLLKKPFNAKKVATVLEELLFTEAFYTIDSEVIRQNDRVILKIIPEKKRLRQLKSVMEYSNHGGFKQYNLIKAVSRKNQLNFLDIQTRFIDDGRDEFVQLSLEQYDFRRNLSKLFFSNRFDFFYLSFNQDDNFFFETVPSFAVPLFKNLLISLSVAAGIHKNFSGGQNELIAEARLALDFHFQSALNRTEIISEMEWTESVLHRYNRKKISINFIRHFLWGDIDLYGQWNTTSGEDMPFNYYYIPFEKIPFIKLEQFYSRDSRIFSAQLFSRPFWGFLRLGIPVQVIDTGEREWGYGLTAFLTIRGFPLRVAGFILDGDFYWSVGTRLSF